MMLEDYLRGMPLAKQVEALKSNLLYAEKERDELRDQVARLEEERAYIGAAFEKTTGTHQANYAILNADRDRLRAALEKYGRHLDTCGLAHYEGSLPCRCGLEEALKGAED